MVQEAYKLDFINDMADSIGKSIQTLAGVTQNGFSSTGFYVGFLLLIILVVGLYVAYTGLIKRETNIEARRRKAILGNACKGLYALSDTVCHIVDEVQLIGFLHHIARCIAQIKAYRPDKVGNAVKPVLYRFSDTVEPVPPECHDDRKPLH